MIGQFLILEVRVYGFVILFIIVIVLEFQVVLYNCYCKFKVRLFVSGKG